MSNKTQNIIGGVIITGMLVYLGFAAYWIHGAVTAAFKFLAQG